MKTLVEPLEKPGENGVPMTCSDGSVRLVFPILAAYVADFPEQCLISCTMKTGCPICIVDPKKRGDPPKRRTRTIDETIKAIRKSQDTGFTQTRLLLGLRNTEPFWRDLPHANMFECFAPDALHQLHKGMFKDHLVKWCAFLLGKDELDRRYKAMPPHHGLRHFHRGIMSIKQWTGREHKQMERVFIGAIAGMPGKADAVQAARCLLDFIYRACYTSISEDELEKMEKDLATFHSLKDVFTDDDGPLQSSQGFHGIAKLHMLLHYSHLIRSLGSADGYSTEATERLHIDYAKLGYRASNRVNYTMQMCIYLQRRQAVKTHCSFRSWMSDGKLTYPDANDDGGETDESDAEDIPPVPQSIIRPPAERRSETYRSHPLPSLKMSKVATFPRLRGGLIASRHDATMFTESVNRYVKQIAKEKNVNAPKVFQDDRYDVWTRVGLLHRQAPFHSAEETRLKEVIRATPASGKKAGLFDTALALVDNEGAGLHGEETWYLPEIILMFADPAYRVVRVKVLFNLPPHCQKLHQGKLAYVEYFTKFTTGNTGVVHMPSISLAKQNGRRTVDIIPLERLRAGCHLIPKFSLMDTNAITKANNLLDTSPAFYFNRYSNPNIFAYLDYWGD